MNNYRRLWSLIFLISACCLQSSFAQDQPTDKHMDKLSSLIGKWKVLNHVKEDDKWEVIKVSNSTITTEHNGRFLREEVNYITSSGEINMITHIGFDGRANQYKLSAMDKEFGMMDIYLGKWENENLIFTNLESDAPYLMEDGQKLWFRLTYSEITQDSFTHLVEGTLDQGKTWFTFSRADFKREDN